MEVEVRSPFPFEALPRIWRWIEPFRAKVSDDFSPQSLDAFVSGMAQKWPGQKSWAIYGDGELGGLITFERLSPWLGTAHIVCKPEMQGKGVAVKALRVAVGEIFTKHGVGKLTFYPLAGNLAMGSLLVNIGAKREGTLEAQTLCGGSPTDVWLYGLTKGAFDDAVSNSRADRRGGLDRGLTAVGEAKDQHPDEQHHADTHASDASPDGSVEQVLNRLDQ